LLPDPGRLVVLAQKNRKASLERQFRSASCVPLLRPLLRPLL
jgi:hypothetical protein